MTLVLIGLLGGLITGISPCILPVLPVIFLTGGAGSVRTDGDATPEKTGDSATSGRLTAGRPYAVVLGLAVSFSLFTLFGSLLLAVLHLPGDVIRWAGLIVLVVLGIGLIVPALERLLERPFSRIPQFALRAGRGSSDRGGFALGLVLGTVYVPCAGPVLAAITVAGATGRIGAGTVTLTLAFAVGTALPLLVFALAGRRVAERVRAFRRHQRAIRVAGGVTMIALAVALTFNLADVIQRTIPDYTASANRALDTGGIATAGGGGSAPGGTLQLQTCQQLGTQGLTSCGPAPEPTGISDWLNTPGGAPVTLASLRGRVVLVDFWAYSCINCQREIAHLDAWNAAYHDAGLTVIGVHTPEYAFEHVPANVAAGAVRLGITYPVAIDNAYDTWNAYSNQSWPAAYLIDAAGQIRNVAIGEGDYGGEEELIRTLLAEARPAVVLPASTVVEDRTPTDSGETRESYLGSQRADSFAGGTSYDNGTRAFNPPARLDDDLYALSGTWTVGDESIAAGAGAGITLDYHASHVYLDVGGTGTLTITQGGRTRTQPVSGPPDIYTVASNASPSRDVVTIRLSPGLSAYSFTFG